MYISGWLQLFLFIVTLLALTKPLGVYLVKVLDSREKTPLDPIIKPVENLLYRFCRIDPNEEQTWKRYALSLGLFSLIGFLFTYSILRLQQYLPLNPQALKGLSPDLAFNTAASFLSNTNWQSYAGESTMSYFSQMVALTLHNFTSAAAGIAVAAALTRGIARSAVQTVGNFWTDIIRITLYLLLPVCLVYSVFLVSQGVVQNFRKNVSTTSIEQIAGERVDGNAVIPQGPVASQEAIKMLGTNGGGFFNANSAHPFENPTPLSNFIQMLSIFLIPSGLTYYLGRMAQNQRHGWTIWLCMLFVFLLGALACWRAESYGNPKLGALGVAVNDGNMEGKELRFGIFDSVLFATVTTDASCGAVNSMHDSFTPLGGMTTLINIQLGEIIFGGVGSGLYGMIVYVVLAVFLAGLMVGRTPEYLGKKIDAYDVKLAVLFLMVAIFSILGFAGCACVKWGVDGVLNKGPHGFSEILYAFSSATGNNGSAFAGISCNTTAFNTTLGIAMLAGRFLMMIPVLGLAGALAGKKRLPISNGSFPVCGATFGILLIGTILIVGALSFLPALALGPIVEHFIMTGASYLY
jgi:K+-transporting ATPase ATPase A chain